MKLRESGMPDEDYWESLLDVDLILARLNIGPNLYDVVELGCGYGTFTLPVAKRIAGILTTVDIDPKMVERTRSRCSGLTNVRCLHRDVFRDGLEVVDASQDACLLFNILHCEEPVRILAESARTVRSGGRVLVIHWRRDISTPRGPTLDIRPSPEQIVNWASQTDLLAADGIVLDLLPWHYGISLLRLDIDRAQK